jgi:hypothetical protein
MRTTLPHTWLVRSAWLTLLLCAIPFAARGQGSPIYRCGNSYGQTPCAGGHVVGDGLSTLHGSTRAAPGQATVYLCQGQGGGQFWAREHCTEHQATIERMETVPASLPWAQQVQQAQRQWEQAMHLTATAASPTGTPRRAAAQRASRAPQQAAQRETRHAAACSKLQARLTQLDSQIPNSAASQEKQRKARTKAEDAYRQQGC